MLQQTVTFPFESILSDEKLDRASQFKQSDIERLLRLRNMVVKQYSEGTFLNVYTNKPVKMMRSFRIYENEKNLSAFLKRLTSRFSPAEDIDKYRAMLGSAVDEEEIENRRQGLESICNKIHLLYANDLPNLEKKCYVNCVSSTFTKMMLNGEMEDYKNTMVNAKIGFSMPLEAKDRFISVLRSNLFESFRELSTNKDLFFKNRSTGETYSFIFNDNNSGKINCNINLNLCSMNLAHMFSLLQSTEVKEITGVPFNDKEFSNAVGGMRRAGIPVFSIVNESYAEVYKKLMRARKLPVFKENKSKNNKHKTAEKNDFEL